jgi:hypothetical protein
MYECECEFCKGSRERKNPSLETGEALQKETLNDILNELRILNNNFKKMEGVIHSRQPMYSPMIPTQQSGQPFKNSITDLINNFDWEKGLRTFEIISALYKSTDKREDQNEDKE